MARRKKGRPVNGILVLDKPAGITSNAALQKVKWLYFAQKAGHTGSLDPLATGVLPVCLGEATKISHFLLDADKRYRATCQLGIMTDTGDSEGNIIATRTVPSVTREKILNLLKSLEGPQQQVPPMFSALKHQGRPLYELARAGKTVERKARNIIIFSIKLLAQRSDSLDIEVFCSKGTYIRTLCEDIGRLLDCGAHITALRRIASGPFNLSQSQTLDKLQVIDSDDKVQLDRLLLPADTAIQSYPMIAINAEQNEMIQQGRQISFSGSEKSDIYRLYFQQKLIALAKLNEEGNLAPTRLLFL